MRVKTISVQIRLTEHEYNRLNSYSKLCGIPLSAYIRNTLNGITPIEQPPAEYFEMIRELFSTANNLNQLICSFTEIYDINPTRFFEDYKLFSETLNKIQETVHRFHKGENAQSRET